MDINATSAANASRPFVKVLTPFTTGDEWVRGKCNRCYKLIVKGVVCEGLAGLQDWHTIQWSVLFVPLAQKLSWFIMTRLRQSRRRRWVLMRCGQFALKKQQQCLPNELDVGDCWIGISLANPSGLILAARVGKHTDEMIQELVVSTEGKTSCKRWNSDNWGGYERILSPEILHYIGKDKTQRCSYAPMALFANKPDDGIVNRISLARYGSRRKSQHD